MSDANLPLLRLRGWQLWKEWVGNLSFKKRNKRWQIFIKRSVVSEVTVAVHIVRYSELGTVYVAVCFGGCVQEEGGVHSHAFQYVDTLIGGVFVHKGVAFARLIPVGWHGAKV